MKTPKKLIKERHEAIEMMKKVLSADVFDPKEYSKWNDIYWSKDEKIKKRQKK